MKLATFWSFGYVTCQLVGLILQLTGPHGWSTVWFNSSVLIIGYLLILLFFRGQE